MKSKNSGATFLRVLVTTAVVSQPVTALAKKPVIDCGDMYQKLYAHSAEMLKSLQKKTDYPFWGRARHAISSAKAEDLEAIFSKMSRADLEDLFYSNNQATPQERQMIEELWNMVSDLSRFGDPFWGKVPDRVYAIREALAKFDKSMGYSDSPAFAAQLTDQGLSKTEEQFISRVLGEENGQKYKNSKTFDGLKRWWNPYNKDLRAVLEAGRSPPSSPKDVSRG